MKPILAFLLTFFILQAFANTDTVLVEDLRYSWLSMEDNEARPIINPEKVNLLSFTLKNTSDEILKICNDEPFDLWINLKLYETAVVGCITADLATIRTNYGLDEINVQVRSESGVDQMSTGLYTLENPVDSTISFLTTGDQTFMTFYVIVLVILLFFTAFFKRYFAQRFEKIFFNPFKYRGASTEDFYSDFFDAANVVSLAYFSLLISFCIHYFRQKSGVGFIESVDLLSMLGVLLLSSGASILFFIIKYLWSAAIALIFGFRVANNIHNQDFINFFTLVFYVVLVFSLIDYSFAYNAVLIPIGIPSVFTAVAIIIFQIGIYLKLQRYIPHNKIMIFSYLCATEFIPGFVLIYLLLK